MNYSSIIHCSVVDGVGIRDTIFISGCEHKCPFCFNKETWDYGYGKEFTQKSQEFLFSLLDAPYITGLTLSGGDPLYSPFGVVKLLKAFRERYGNTKNVWIYTGFTMEQILKDPNKKAVIDLCDVVVDGMFDNSKKDLTIAFRGSTNQVIWEKDSEGKYVRSALND